MTNHNTRFSSLFNPNQIICCASDNGSDNRLDHTIHQLMNKISVFNPAIDIESVYHLLLYREACGFIMIKPDVAVIHVRIKELKQLHIAIATSRKGLICSPAQHGFKCITEDTGPVKIVFLMLVPTDDPTSYLRAIAALKIIFRREHFSDTLLSLKQPDDIWNAFDQSGETLPEYLEARHIMRTDFSYLQVSDTLDIAIDLFCKKSLDEFPVVDAEGDLIGVVSEEELIQLCLPEYITWMDDLSPILNFEPFAEILRREKNMPVMEIMKFDNQYATIDESTPAIQVAKIMMRREVRQVFVVHQKKLMGIISIQDLIQKVLRA